jgi:O-antigen ligase
MPFDVLFSRDALVHGSQRRLLTEIGYHRVDLSVILAGASWSLLAARTLVASPRRGSLVLILAAVVTYAQALTGGRGGYFAWLVVGISLSLLRWPRYLLLAPVIALALSLLPGVADRTLEGLTYNTDTSSFDEVDVDSLTAGRNFIWSMVLDKIAEEPIVGYGRSAMTRTGLSTAIAEASGEDAPGNPHSAYLEALLDNGAVGLAATLALFGFILVNALSLTRDSRSPVFAAMGGVASALVIAQLAGSVTGQSFYPREGTLGMWCAVGLMMRVIVERARALAASGRHERAPAATTSGRLHWVPAEPARPPAATPEPPERPRAVPAWWQPAISAAAPSLDTRLWN